jgi:hypothetical protein
VVSIESHFHQLATHIPGEFVANHLDINLLAHAKPKTANEVFVDPWLEFTHPVALLAAIYRVVRWNLPEGGFGIATSSLLTRNTRVLWWEWIAISLRWELRGSTVGSGLRSIAILGLLRGKTFELGETHIEIDLRSELTRNVR